MIRGNAAANPQKVSRTEAEEAVRTLLRYLGEDVTRPGLLDTPERVVRAWEEWCSGYGECDAGVLDTFFEDIKGYDQPVIMRNITFISHCEHHMANMPGKAHLAYWPDKKVIGISKLARVVDVFARRLQSQENLTREIAESLQQHLEPKGVAVVLEAEHACMTTRGANKPESRLLTQFFTGCFKSDFYLQQQVVDMLRPKD
jgi:GTP cyclohydrolase I